MSLVNPELALAKAQEFVALLAEGWEEFRADRHGEATANLRGMLPLIREMAGRVGKLYRWLRQRAV